MSRLGRARRYYGCSGYDCTLNDEKSKQIRGPSVTVPCGCFSAELGPPLLPGSSAAKAGAVANAATNAIAGTIECVTSRSP
jgi:hypothetical protein